MLKATTSWLTVIIIRRASIMPSMTYRLLVSPPAHKGPRMVARPPIERLTPWLKPSSQRIKHYICTVFDSAICTAAVFPWITYATVKFLLPTLCFLCSDFGEERHLRHSHKGKPEQLQKHSNDEGRQLPSITTWQGYRHYIKEMNGSLDCSCLSRKYFWNPSLNNYI